MNTDATRFLTVDNIRAMLGNPSLTTLWKWCKEGQLPKPIKIGGTRLWDSSEIADFLERRRAARNVRA